MMVPRLTARHGKGPPPLWVRETHTAAVLPEVLSAVSHPPKPKMKQQLMNRFGIILGTLAFVASLILLGGGIPSCSTPQQNARLVALSEIGLALAKSKGLVSEGDTVLIRNGLAVVTSEQSDIEKVFSLGRIGLHEAVQEGMIKEGDSVLIEQAAAVILSTQEPPEMTGANRVHIENSFNNMGNPQPPELTSGKSPTQSPLPPPGS